MKTVSRLFKHLIMTKAAGRRAFPASALKTIQAAIAKGEALHRAEVRLIVEPALDAGSVLRQVSSRERARELFAHYRIWDTEENSGVLVYINLADHKVEIITDRAVGRVLKAGDWLAVCRSMTQGFAHGEYGDSAVAGLLQMNELLKTHFPANGSSPNELSNRPLVL